MKSKNRTDAQQSLFPVETEQQIKRRKLKEMASRRNEYLETLRKTARHLCYSNAGFPFYRVPNIVTSDDVRECLEINPLPRGHYDPLGSRNLHGAIFSDGHWSLVGFVSSRAKGRHGSLIRAWTLNGYAKETKEEWNKRGQA